MSPKNSMRIIRKLINTPLFFLSSKTERYRNLDVLEDTDGFCLDTEALSSDWKNVGFHLNNALTKISNSQKIEK